MGALTTLRYPQRLHTPAEFKAVYAERRSVPTAHVLVCYRRNDLGFSRVGLSVGCKHGNAVQRNRIKRVYRAAFRLCQQVLPVGFDYVLIPRNGVKEYATEAVRAALTQAAARIKKAS